MTPTQPQTLTMRPAKNVAALKASSLLVTRVIPGTVNANDALRGEEGMFSICSFWLVEALTRAGHLTDVRLLLEKILSYAMPCRTG